MNARTVYSVGEALQWRELREMLNRGEPPVEATWRAAERMESIRGSLATGHNRLIDYRVAALHAGRADIADAFAVGARVALDALNILLASADTHAERRDVKQARPARVGSAVAKPDAQTPIPSSRERK